MPTNTGGGTTTSLDNTPQAKDDFFIASEDQVYCFNVMANDLGGNAKVMWSIDNTSDDGSGDLVAKDVAGVSEYSELGARIWITSDGKIAYDTNALDSLPEGTTIVDQFTYAIRLSNGTLSWATVNVTLTGTNDRPVAVAAANAVNEDASITGNVTATDADAGETATLTYALVNPAPAGLTLNSDGSYSFDASSYDSLVAGEQLVLTIAFTATDVHGWTSLPANLVITVTGTNDVPVASAAVAAVNEDATISGSVTATDADSGETATLTYALVNPAPTGLTLNSDGSYSFDASSYDSLIAGEQLILTIPFTASDATSTSAPANLVITVTGTNDIPVANAAVNAVNEDAMISGSVTATDADAGETATLTYALVNPAPTGLTFNPNGSYSFDASSYDSLVAGEQLILTIPFTATDVQAATSAPANLVITITGTNDVPVASAAVNAVLEDASISGNVSATDADAGETATLTYALVNPAPTGLTFNSDGSYSFDASSYDYLTAGEPLVLTIPFTASDATSTSAPANLVITVTGTNDVPVANAAVNAVLEDASISGNVTASDADFGEIATLTFALVNPAPVGLTFNADGSYSFDASSYDYLTAGQPLVITVPFTATDVQAATSAPANLVITVTGTNDVPFANVAVNAVNEDAMISGNVTASDADSGETATLTYALVNPAPTGLTFNSDGSYSFDASSYDYLTAGEPLVLTIPFTATDVQAATSAPANLVITITGTNDAPDIRLVTTDSAAATLTETNAGLSTSGTLTVNDPDTTDVVSSSVTAVVASGTTAGLGLTNLQLLAMLGVTPTSGLPANAADLHNLTWNFNSGTEAFNYLNAGQSLTLTYTVTSSDGNGGSDTQNVTITIDGTNDAPTVANIKFVPNGNDFNTALPNPGEQIGSFVAYDAAGNIIPGATFTVTAGSSGSLTVAPSGLVTGGLGNGDVWNFNITSGGLTETVSVQVGNGSPNPITGSPGNLDIMFGFNGGDTLTGGDNDDTLYGNNVADTLNGGDGDDFLIGGNDGDNLNGENGNDFLRGGVGNDILNGGAGSDVFAFNVVLIGTNSDIIQDFNATGIAGFGDKIALDDAIFTAFTGQLTLAPSQFVSNATGTAVGTGAQIIFNTSTGALTYDTNGTSAGGSTQFATLTLLGITGSVDSSDFLII